MVAVMIMSIFMLLHNQTQAFHPSKLLFWRHVGLHEHFRKAIVCQSKSHGKRVEQNLPLKFLLASDLFYQQWHLDNIELVIKFLYLVQVLLLHLPSRITLHTLVGLLWKQ